MSGLELFFNKPVFLSFFESNATTTGDGLFLIKVMDVKGDSVVVATRNSLWHVRAQIPLTPGQSFLVKPEQKDGLGVRLRIVKEISTPAEELHRFSLPLILKELGVEIFSKEGIFFISLLKKAGLPLTEQNLNRIKILLNKLGGVSCSNILAAIIATRLNLPVKSPLIEMINSFSNLILSDSSVQAGFSEQIWGETYRHNAELRWEELINLRLKTIFDQLRELFVSILKQQGDVNRSIFTERYQSIVKHLWGGQLVAWAVDYDAGPFYYIPFFAFLNRDIFPKGELLIYPRYCFDSENSNDSELFKDGCWRIVLNIETQNLGWIQIDLKYKDSLLQLSTLVENHKAKAIIDECWPQLERRLVLLNLKLDWLGCKTGTVKKISDFPGEKVDLSYPGLDLLA